MSLTSKNRLQRLSELVTLFQIDGIGTTRFYELVSSFGSAERTLAASLNELTHIPGIGRETASKIGKLQDQKKAAAIVKDIIRRGWNYFLYDDSDYPQSLRDAPDHPPFLFYLGDYKEPDQNAIAIVGSRMASAEGRLFAENLASALAENNITVISGMARGIDTSAHRGALKSGGRTIAVFGSSLDVIYPPEGREMARQIAQSGVIFSEFLPKTAPLAPNFPKRNRIISGLSQGVVVIEAAERSGALSTAGHALLQNREVFAVPGSPRSEKSRGTNKLIKEGAKLLTCIDDIFTELPRLKGQVKSRHMYMPDELTNTEKMIIQSCAEGPMQIDGLSRCLKTPVTDLMQILLALELKGMIKELAGKRYMLS
ncbi:MAG: DNA-processing protein DprA [candidate division Zixibacteria bacterium]|nr:DNA-processing protein DprA [candidate division Zixibacteria bacterium]